MMRRSRGAAAGAVLLVLGLFLAMPGVVLAGDTDDQSTHGAAYLRMGAGARALGMGGAAVAAGQGPRQHEQQVGQSIEVAEAGAIDRLLARQAPQRPTRRALAGRRRAGSIT